MYISHEAQFVVNDWKLNQNFEEKKSENRLFKNFDVIILTSDTYSQSSGLTFNSKLFKLGQLDNSLAPEWFRRLDLEYIFKIVRDLNMNILQYYI